MMQSRHAAFAILRKLALRDFVEIPPKIPIWSRSAARPFHHIAPRPFNLSTRHYDDQLPTQTLPQESDQPQELVEPQESVQEPYAPIPSALRKKAQIPKTPIPFDKQVYEMTFTCTPCKTRSTHQVSKQGYHSGSVLITCPECKNRHIIADHLGIFSDKELTIEDLMRERGQLVKKGTLSEDGSLEFWEDGTTTRRER